jgi:hypothetical protein
VAAGEAVPWSCTRCWASWLRWRYGGDPFPGLAGTE